MNAKAIADNIAACFTGTTVTIGAGTEAIAIGPTASLPNDIAKGPALLVFPPSGPLDVGVSAMRADVLRFPVRLLRDPLDVPSRIDALYAWYTAMRDKVEANTDLGLPTYVLNAQPIAMRIDLDGGEYAGRMFDLVELLVEVSLREHVTTLAV